MKSASFCGLLCLSWILVWFAVGIFACSYFVPLRVSEIYFCDQYKNGRCRLRQSDHFRIYRPRIPETRAQSWFDLGYYMYFHSRETPGIRIDFNRSLSSSERQILSESLVCTMRLTSRKGESIETEMEGRRVDDTGFWCFDYLGSNLVALMKELGQATMRPRRSFFPIELELRWQSKLPGIFGKKGTLLEIDWQLERAD